MIRAWRLAPRAHARSPRQAYSGIGAQRRGGRWNRIGTRAAYASSTRSLAALEYLAHLDPEDLPADLVFVGIAFDTSAVANGDPPTGWQSLHSAVAIQYGETWLRSMTSPVLSVPSAIISAELNYIINPGHTHARTFKIDREPEEFIFDERLFAKR